jgi:hypothetical protein
MGSDAGASALAQYTTHRNCEAAPRAVKSLTRTKGSAASARAGNALSRDADAIGARHRERTSLRSRRRTACPSCSSPLDHRVNEAAASIGQHCNPEQCSEALANLNSASCPSTS